MSSTHVVTGVVRLSYEHLFEPFGFEDQEPKYSTVILVPKSDKATIKAIQDAQQAALEQGKDTRFGGKIPSSWKNTFRDGDEATDRNPEYKGHMFMSVSSKTRPGVVDKNVQPIMDRSEVYSGCYARVSMDAFPYSVSGSRGVSFGLRHVMKWEDGEPLGNITKPEDDFADIASGSGLI